MPRQMKDSGVEWIGEIPNNWSVIKHKYVMHKEKDICDKYSGEDIISLTMSGVIVRDLEAGGKMPATFDGYQYVEPGDLLQCLFDIDVTPRCVGLVKNYGLTSPAYSRFKIHTGYFAPYYDYLLRSIDNDKVFVHLSKNLRSSLTETDFGVLPTIAPNYDEQVRIADFLDSKCAYIDSVIEKTKASIEEYKKLKQAIITEAVTKGVRGERPMKDSEIEWIKQIPENWGVDKGKHILKVLNRPVLDDDQVITCFRDGEVTLRSKRRETGFTFSMQEVGYQGIDVGDLVVHGMDGFAGAIGISDSRGKGTPVLNVLDSNENKRYLMYCLRSMAYIGVFLSLATGIRVRSCDTNWNKLKEILYILPPRDEQEEIVDYIDNKLFELNLLIEKKESFLECLENYKKSLIYEYVTGKKEVPTS